MRMVNLLLIDDDQRLGKLLTEFFKQHAMTLDHALLPSDGFKNLQNHHYDLVILDIMLPEMDGFEVCKKIRKQSDIPIIMLTARGDVMDRIIGIELGADDYLPKPFEPRELIARIQSILKRTNAVNQKSQDSSIISIGELIIDTNLRQVRLSNNALELSTMEYNCILLLASHPGKTFSRDEILNALKGIHAEIFSRSVDIFISRLRNKPKPHEMIKTIQ